MDIIPKETDRSNSKSLWLAVLSLERKYKTNRITVFLIMVGAMVELTEQSKMDNCILYS